MPTSIKFSATVRSQEGGIVPVELCFLYDEDDPYVVDMIISQGGQTVRWVLSRELLNEGQRGKAGIADVIVRPHFDDPEDFSRPCMTNIRLSSDDGRADVRFVADLLTPFLIETYELVPKGMESGRLRVDAVIRRIFVHEGKGWDCPVPEPKGHDPDGELPCPGCEGCSG